MVVDTNMMFSRPINCRYCEHGYYGLLHVVQYAEQLGHYNLIDISAGQATKAPIYQAIEQYQPGSFYGFGHGNDCVFTGDTERAIFTCDECSILQGQIVYLLSCLTGNGLGPAIIDNGGRAYAGYIISWTWMGVGAPEGDPYDDKYAHGFFESANEFWLSIIDHKTVQQAYQDSIDKYNEWIDYWTDSNDPDAANAIKWLIHDRDGLIILGDLNASLPLPWVCEDFTTKDECLAHDGCWWYNGGCHSEKPPWISETKTFIVQLLPPVAKIGDISYPDTVFENQTFVVEYDVQNTMALENILWGQIVDKTTGEVIPGSYWEQTVVANETIHITITCGPITYDAEWKIQAGHVE